MENDSSPLVSVIIATHNRAELLPQAVDSLLNQTYQNFEIIIVDDDSVDNTPKTIEKLKKKDHRIHSIRSEQNIGPGATRNMGVSLAQSDFIAILDDDDLAEPERLSIQISIFERKPETELAFSAVLWIDDSLNPINIFPGILQKAAFPENSTDIFKLLYLESNKIPNTTIFARRHVFERYKYPHNPWVGEDWFLFLQMSASGINIKGIQEPLVRQRRGENRQGLMGNKKTVVFDFQRKVLRMTKDWLHEQNNHDYDHLHKLALSNQIIRESRHFIGLRGLGMLANAFLLAPNNPKVGEQLHWYMRKALQKFGINKS